MEIRTTYVCAHCLQLNEILVDGSAGREQEYVEECQVCCRPNTLAITIDEDLQQADVQAETA